MLITKEVITGWNSWNKKYYESKGYMYTKNNDLFAVKVEDVKKRSSLEIEIICDKCGKLFKSKIVDYNRRKYGDFCKQCALDERKYDQDFVFDYFKKYGLNVLEGEIYTGFFNPIKFICTKHPEEGIQERSFVSIKYSKAKGCSFCEADSLRGENNPCWRGGTTSELQLARGSSEYPIWRKSVFERDNYTCQCCGDSSGANLNAHHLQNFSVYKELRYDVNNGITLCENCHGFKFENSFHSIYGTQNNSKEQLLEYINNKNNTSYTEIQIRSK